MEALGFIKVLKLSLNSGLDQSANPLLTPSFYPSSHQEIQPETLESTGDTLLSITTYSLY